MSAARYPLPAPLPSHLIGSKFRPVHWSDIYADPAVIVGWGVEEMPAGTSRYIPRSLGPDTKTDMHPFKTKKEAKAHCAYLNAACAAKETS